MPSATSQDALTLPDVFPSDKAEKRPLLYLRADGDIGKPGAEPGGLLIPAGDYLLDFFAVGTERKTAYHAFPNDKRDTELLVPGAPCPPYSLVEVTDLERLSRAAEHPRHPPRAAASRRLHPAGARRDLHRTGLPRHARSRPRERLDHPRPGQSVDGEILGDLDLAQHVRPGLGLLPGRDARPLAELPRLENGIFQAPVLIHGKCLERPYGTMAYLDTDRGLKRDRNGNIIRPAEYVLGYLGTDPGLGSPESSGDVLVTALGEGMGAWNTPINLPPRRGRPLQHRRHRGGRSPSTRST